MCPAAFLIAGATRSQTAVLCRIDSTSRGQFRKTAGPVALVKPAVSPATFHGNCMNGHIQDAVREIRALGPFASPEEHAMADAAARTGAELSYDRCSSWRAERVHRDAMKAADQKGRHRTHELAA